MKKKIIYIFLILITILNLYCNVSFASELVEDTLITIPSNIDSPDINDLEIYTDHILMMERSTGNILYDKNGSEKMYPASTTKILTAILVIENCSLNESAEVTSLALKAVPAGYATCNIQIGEKFTVKDLLYTMLIRSANDAANVLAIHVSDSITGFSELMNKKAEEIGCTASHFTNPSGVHDEEHYATARDLALIADYAMNLATFRDIVTTTTYSLPATEKYPHEDRTFTISNSLVNPDDKKYYYEYATGIKTGYTNASKDCVVASAKKDGIEFIVVVLGSGQTQNGLRQKYLDCKTLFYFAFDNYTTYYKELQAKRESKFNPFTEIYNFLTGQGEEENQETESNISNQEELQVTAEPIEVKEIQIPEVESSENSSALIIIIVILICIIIVLLVIGFLLLKKNNSRNNRSRRRVR